MHEQSGVMMCTRLYTCRPHNSGYPFVNVVALWTCTAIAGGIETYFSKFLLYPFCATWKLIPFGRRHGVSKSKCGSKHTTQFERLYDWPLSPRYLSTPYKTKTKVEPNLKVFPTPGGLQTAAHFSFWNSALIQAERLVAVVYVGVLPPVPYLGSEEKFHFTSIQLEGCHNYNWSMRIGALEVIYKFQVTRENQSRFGRSDGVFTRSLLY